MGERVVYGVCVRQLNRTGYKENQLVTGEDKMSQRIRKKKKGERRKEYIVKANMKPGRAFYSKAKRSQIEPGKRKLEKEKSLFCMGLMQPFV